MKTKIVSILCLSIAASSCTQTVYKMGTVINRDGSVVREINAVADSAFLAGDTSAGPFLFEVDGSWDIIDCDSVTTGYYRAGRPYVTIRKKAGSVEEFSHGLRYEEYRRSLAAPDESLKKRFRWFYTYYDFKAVYPEISEKGPVPISDYLDANELALWLRGDMSAYPGLNGVELKEVLDNVDERFWKWYSRNVYEIYFEVILEFTTDNTYRPLLLQAKDSIFTNNEKNIRPFDFTLDDMFEVLDKHFSTGYFSSLYSGDREAIDSELEKKANIENLFEYKISYSLAMPGKLLSTNATMSEDGKPVWKVDAWRILAGDYTLAAESRTPNYWAWVIVFIIPVCCFVLTGRRGR